MGLSTHILDVHRGKPAAGVEVALALLADGGWQQICRAVTDAEGRCATLLGTRPLEAATYRLRFHTAPFFAAHGEASLYPFIEITVEVRSPDQHHHVPLLLAANSFTTYRGS